MKSSGVLLVCQMLVTCSTGNQISTSAIGTPEPTATIGMTPTPLPFIDITPSITAFPEGAFGGLECGTGIYAIAYSPDGIKLAAASQDSIYICDTESLALLRRISSAKMITGGVRWSPDGERVASGTKDGMILIWEFGTGDEIESFQVGPSEVYGFVWSSDGKYIATTNSGDLHVWNADKGIEEFRIEGSGDGSVLDWSSNGKWLAFGCTCNTVFVWDAASKELATQLEGSLAPVLGISPDGSAIATQIQNGPIRIYALPIGNILITLERSTDATYSLAWSPKGNWIAGGSWDGNIGIWNALTGNKVLLLNGATSEPVWSMTWAPDGSNLAGIHGDRIILWDMRELK